MYLSKNEAFSYLRYYCLNNDTVERIYQRAYNCMILKKITLRSQSNDDPDNDLEKILSDKNKHPESYEMYDLPKYMDSDVIKFDVFGEAPMHCLFLGISKTIYIDIQSWLKVTKKEKKFLKMVDGVLDFIHQLNISWCRCPPYSKNKTVGFVSENFVGYERLAEWFMSILHYIDDAYVYEDPTSNPRTWRKPQYQHWLTARGMDSTGKLEEL